MKGASSFRKEKCIIQHGDFVPQSWMFGVFNINLIQSSREEECLHFNSLNFKSWLRWSKFMKSRIEVSIVVVVLTFDVGVVGCVQTLQNYFGRFWMEIFAISRLVRNAQLVYRPRIFHSIVSEGTKLLSIKTWNAESWFFFFIKVTESGRDILQIWQSIWKCFYKSEIS